MYYQASATDPECSSQSGLYEPKKKLMLPLSSSGTLASNSRSHQIQGTDVCLQDHTGPAPL